MTERALRTGKQLREERGKELFGFSYISTAVPIIENGEIAGVVSAVISNQRVETIRTGAAELTATVEEMTSTTEQVAEASNEVAGSLQGLSTQSQKVMEDVAQIDAVVRFVQEVADQSHLLGLNAAIEAARAGEHGRGFEVVASEIRKMAAGSKNAAIQIKKQLESIQKAIKEFDAAIQHIAAFTEEHSASLQELNAAFGHIVQTAEKLSTLDS